MRNHIAPLQLPTLAAFLPWGSSEGAGRMTLIRRKDSETERTTRSPLTGKVAILGSWAREHKSRFLPSLPDE